MMVDPVISLMDHLSSVQITMALVRLLPAEHPEYRTVSIPNSASDWVRNDFDLAGIPGYSGTLGPGEALNTPGMPNEIYVAPPEMCGDPFTPIFDVQGNGFSSPLVGS